MKKKKKKKTKQQKQKSKTEAQRESWWTSEFFCVYKEYTYRLLKCS